VFHIRLCFKHYVNESTISFVQVLAIVLEAHGQVLAQCLVRMRVKLSSLLSRGPEQDLAV